MAGWRLQVYVYEIFVKALVLARTISGRNAAQCAFLPESARGLFFMQYVFPETDFSCCSFARLRSIFTRLRCLLFPLKRQHEGVFASFSLEKKPAGGNSRQNHKG